MDFQKSTQAHEAEVSVQPRIGVTLLSETEGPEKELQGAARDELICWPVVAVSDRKSNPGKANGLSRPHSK